MALYMFTAVHMHMHTNNLKEVDIIQTGGKEEVVQTKKPHIT